MSNTLFTSPGTIEVVSVTISTPSGKNIDITDLVLEYNIFEALYSPILKGSMLLADAAGILANLPIAGQEQVLMKYKRDDVEHEIDMYTTNIEKISNINEYGQTYIINLVQDAYLRNATSLISRSFVGPISTMMELISEEYLFQIIDVEDTAANFRFVIPNWTPYKTLNWLARRARTVENIPFALINTMMGGLQFLSLKTLYEQDPIDTFYAKMKDTDPGQGDIQVGSAALYSDYMRSAGAFYPLEISPSAEIIQKGAYSSTTSLTDFFNKTYKEFHFDYKQQYDRLPHLGKLPTMSDEFLINDKDVSKHFKSTQKNFAHSSESFGEAHTDYNGTVLESLPFRQSQINTLGNYRYRLGIPGRFDIQVGSTVNLSINKNRLPDSTDTEEWVDKRRSGKHIVTSLRHQFSIPSSRYTIMMDVARDTMDLEYE